MEEQKDSEYNKFLETLRQKRQNEAKEVIPKMCDILNKHDPRMSKEDIRKKVEMDAKEFWAVKTIVDHLPKEYKDKIRSEVGKIGQEVKQEKKKQMIAVTTNNFASVTEAKYHPINQKEQDSRTFQPSHKIEVNQIPQKSTIIKIIFAPSPTDYDSTQAFIIHFDLSTNKIKKYETVGRRTVGR